MTAKKQLTFASCWTVIYTFVFNLANTAFSFAKLLEIVLGAGWVFLFFLIATYSRIFFFTAIPIVFITSGLVVYAEKLMNAPISRDVVSSAFESNWQEIHGIINNAFWSWLLIGLLCAVLCLLHLSHLKLAHPWQKKFLFTVTFLIVFGLCARLMFPPFFWNTFYWQHPYDYLEYTLNFLREKTAQSSVKFDLSSFPIKEEPVQSNLPLQVVVIIGESARADHLGVYGYQRNTTPLLQKEQNLLLFQNVSTCGTATIVSVPCLMTRATRQNLKPAKEETSFVSLFKKLGFKPLWVSEQAKFNGVNSEISPIADEAEKTVFQDNNLTVKVQEFKNYFQQELKSSKQKSLAIFHMTGSHAPYQWFYPKEFKYFTPTCPELLPNSCPHDLLINNYDNTIVYTDYFLAGVIDAIRDKNAIMVYVSDHGEYLGERGRYLHGQETEDAELRHVPMIWWVSDQFIKLYPKKVTNMRSKLRDKLSHDNVFHSVLNCAGIDSPVIDKKLSICE